MISENHSLLKTFSKMASQNDIAAAEAEFKKKFGGMGGGMKPQWVL